MNNTPWTPDEEKFVRENVGKLDFADIGRQIGRSPLAVKLFIHRRRIAFRPSVRNNLVIKLLRIKFGNPEYFRPTKEFYSAIGITQMRFWALYRGEVQVSEKEYKALCSHFCINAEAAFEARQISLFENGGGVKRKTKEIRNKPKI